MHICETDLSASGRRRGPCCPSRFGVRAGSKALRLRQMGCKPLYTWNGPGGRIGSLAICAAWPVRCVPERWGPPPSRGNAHAGSVALQADGVVDIVGPRRNWPWAQGSALNHGLETQLSAMLTDAPGALGVGRSTLLAVHAPSDPPPRRGGARKRRARGPGARLATPAKKQVGGKQCEEQRVVPVAMRVDTTARATS